MSAAYIGLGLLAAAVAATIWCAAYLAPTGDVVTELIQSDADDAMAIADAVREPHDPLAAYAREMADIAPRFAKLDRNGRTGAR